MSITINGQTSIDLCTGTRYRLVPCGPKRKMDIRWEEKREENEAEEEYKTNQSEEMAT